jgi:N-acetylmuramoyl-L-alanine amidase
MRNLPGKGLYAFSLTLFLAAALIITLNSFETVSPPQTIVKTIVVDAGHGQLENGGYHGAKGSFSYEDEICLAVAKELVPRLQEAYPEIRIVETRPTEKFVANYRRAEIANENKGDLFICIHANSAPAKKHSEITGYKNVPKTIKKNGKKVKVTKKVPIYRYWTTPSPAKGTETYIWGAHKNDDKEVAMRENASVMLEENFETNYGGIDLNSPEFIALSLLKTKQYFKRSATLAGFIQDEFAKVGRVDRDVRQRPIGIWVLQATAMPSVLIETGFVTHPEDEAYLNSKEGQKELAECVTRAVANYIAWIQKQNAAPVEGTSGKIREQSTKFLDIMDQHLTR